MAVPLVWKFHQRLQSTEIGHSGIAKGDEKITGQTQPKRPEDRLAEVWPLRGWHAKVGGKTREDLTMSRCSTRDTHADRTGVRALVTGRGTVFVR